MTKKDVSLPKVTYSIADDNYQVVVAPSQKVIQYQLAQKTFKRINWISMIC